MAVFLLDDMRPTLIPAPCSSWMSAIVDGKVFTPCSSTSALKKAFLRLPSPHTVSSSGESAGSPLCSSMPREARKSRTPS